MRAATTDPATQLTVLDTVDATRVDARRVEARSTDARWADGVAEVYDGCATALFGYTASLTNRRDIAEEIVQESFVRLVAAVRAGRAPDEPRAWLYTVATNLAVSRSRRRSIAARWLPMLVPRGDDLLDEAAEDTVLRRERHVAMRAALSALSREHRAAVLLAAEGFSGREIAAILRRSEGATRNILWRARLSLRDRLEAGRLR